MSRYPGYHQGQWSGGYDEGRAWAPRNPTDGWYSETETDPPEASMATSSPVSQVMSGGGETFKRPAQYSGEDFTRVADAKRSRFETGGVPVKGECRDGEWRCGTCDMMNIKGRNYCTQCYSSHDKGNMPSEDLPSQIDVADRSRTFFVFNLMLKTTASDLIKYFAKFGDLVMSRVLTNDEGKSTGAGIVKFVHEGAAVAFLAARPHFIHKKQIVISHDRRSDPRISGNVKSSLEKYTLHVSNIPLDVCAEDLCEYFSQWGNISNSRIAENAPRTRNKTFAFVSYANFEDAMKCLMTTHSYGQSAINVQVSSFCKALFEAEKEKKIKADAEKPEEANKLLVTNIPDEVTDDGLMEHFSMWGILYFCSIGGNDESFRNNKYGFVCFQKQKDALTALMMPHSLRHQEIVVSVAHKNGPLLKASKDPKIMSAVKMKVQNCSLCVSNVSARTTVEEFHDYFKKYGALACCMLKPAGLVKLIAFLGFVKEADATRCYGDVHFLNQKKLYLHWSDVTKWREGDVRGFARPNIPAIPVPPKPEPPRKLRISGLAANTPAFKLMCYFSRWGKVENLELVKDDNLGSTGCALVTFEKPGDAQKAASAKPHVFDNKEVEVVYTEPQKKLPSATFPTWREQRHHEPVQQQRLPESIKLLDQGFYPPELQRLLDKALPQRLPEKCLSRRQSTPEPLMPRLKQIDIFPDTPLVTEYECNVSGCSFTGKSEQFKWHWTERHEAKVRYVLCLFCSMEFVYEEDLCEHLNICHGVDDKSEISTFLRFAKQQERDNIHYIMPGRVTWKTCMKVKEPPQKKDVYNCTECTFTGTVDEFLDHWDKNHLSGLSHLKCPKCPKTFMKKDFFLLHVKYQHQNTEIRTEKTPEDIKDNFEESQNLNFGSSRLQRVCHEMQRKTLGKSEADIPTISDIGSKSTHTGNRSLQMKPKTLSSVPFQNVSSSELPILPTWQPDPSSDQQLLPSQMPTQQAMPLHGQETPFNPSTTFVPKPVLPPLVRPPFLRPPPPFLRPPPPHLRPPPPLLPLPVPPPTPQPVPPPTPQSVPPPTPQPVPPPTPQPVPPPTPQPVHSPTPQPVPPPPPQPVVRSQPYSPTSPLSPVPWFSNTSTQQPVVPVVSTQSYIVPPVVCSQAPFQPLVRAQLQQASIVASAPTHVVASISPSVVPPTSSLAGAPNIIPELDVQDLIDVEMGNVTPQSPGSQSESEPEIVTENRAIDELKRSVQSGSVLALRPEWTNTLKVAHPKKSSLGKKSSNKTIQVKFIPEFDRTHTDTVKKFLLWSHIMMERLEDANIQVRRRLKADAVEGNAAEVDDDDDVEDPEEMLELLSDEEIEGGNVRTEVKGTLTQQLEDMKARVQAVAWQVVADYRSMDNSKATGVGKQGLVERKVIGQLFEKAIGMVTYESKRDKLDADLIRKGITWVKKDIIELLEPKRRFQCEKDHVEVYMDEYVNEEYSLAYVGEDGVHVMGDGGHFQSDERMDDETDDICHGMDQGLSEKSSRRKRRRHRKRGRGGRTTNDQKNIDDIDLQMHDRKDDTVKRDGNNSGKPGKQIDNRNCHQKLRKRSRRGKASNSKKSIDLEKDGVTSKNKDQMSGGNKKEKKGGDKTKGDRGNTVEKEQDGISDGDLSADGSLCEFDVDGTGT